MKTIWDGLAGAIMEVLGAVPLPAVKLIAIGIFLALAFWAAFLPRDYVYRGAESQARWRDVRIWAAVVIGLEIIPYLFF